MTKSENGYEINVAYVLVEGDIEDVLFKDKDDEKVYNYYSRILRAIREMAEKKCYSLIPEEGTLPDNELDTIFNSLMSEMKNEIAPYQFVSVINSEKHGMTSNFSHMAGKQWGVVTVPKALVEMRLTSELIDYINEELPTYVVGNFKEFEILSF